MERLVGARYRLGAVIGGGAFGTVVRALDRASGRWVAVKVSADVARLRREYAVLRAVDHPHVVRALELRLGEGQAALVMEHVQGADFVSAVRADLPPPPKAAGPRRNLPMAFGYPMQEEGVSAYRDCGPEGHRRLRAWLPLVARALEAVHRSGHLHLDVRPSNVRVGHAPVLLDLGLAHPLGEPVGSEAIVGGATYLAPELALGRAAQASDAYSLGVMLFEALTGRAPFEGGGPEVLVAKQSLSAPTPKEVVGTIPDDLDAICRGLLARSPEDRMPLAAVRSGGWG